jgi:hypothetical protein
MNNTAVGVGAGSSLQSGNSNVAIGNNALNALMTGSNNIAMGGNAGQFLQSGNNNIYIGSGGAGGDSGVIRIGNLTGAQGTQGPAAFIAGISNTNLASLNTMPVVVDQFGQLGVVLSSRRFKKDIQDMADASAGLMQLRPVTYHYKEPSSDGSEPIQYGLIAEEVADVFPELVARSADGQPYAVRYQYLDALLLNELQKQNATITLQKEKIKSLEERLSRLESLLAGTAGGGHNR